MSDLIKREDAVKVCCEMVCGAGVWGKDTEDWRVATMGERRAKKAAADAWNRRVNDGI